jgi:hypothetical protein
VTMYAQVAIKSLAVQVPPDGTLSRRSGHPGPTGALMMIFPFRSDPLVTVSITILNTIGLVTVLLFALMWRRVASLSDPHASTGQQAMT